MVIAIGVFSEGVSRLFDPPDINTNQLLAVSFAGLCVNLLGILAFRLDK
jgi:solute carrier family 30 (zinc transporter), member 5/7